MIPDVFNQMMVYKRPTIGPSINVSATQALASQELFKEGLYIIQNMGPNICYLEMKNQDHSVLTGLVTTNGFPLFPYGSQERSSFMVQVGLLDVKNIAAVPGQGLGGGHPLPMKYLHHICAAGETATLRVTRVTLD